MKGLSLFILSLLLLAGCQDAPTATEAPARPNIILIQMDDLGYDDLSLHGNRLAETPVIDRLGEEGLRFDRFYVNPVCAPTRASLLTGLHFLRTGVSHVHGGKDYIHRDIPTIADQLSRQGYACGMWGKWHSGAADGYYPWQRGFREAFMAKLYKHENAEGLFNGQPVSTRKWADEVVMDYAIDFVERHRDTTFFAYISSMACHAPLRAPEENIARFRDKGVPEKLATLYGMVHFFDQQLARLLARLDELGLAENTVILFMSDNGPAVNNGILSDEERALQNVNGFKGYKGNLWENGVRSPLFIRWGGRYAGQVRPERLDITDILPTVLQLAGAEEDSIHQALDGQSFSTLLADPESVEPWRKTIFNYAHPGWQPTDAPWTPEGVLDEYAPISDKEAQLPWQAQPISVIEPPYKLILNPGSISNGPEVQNGMALFDLDADPKEDFNLAETRPEVASRLRAEAEQWFEGVKAFPHAFAPPAFMIGPGRENRLPLYAPLSAFNGVKVGYNFLHQLEEGGGAAYRIEVKEGGKFTGTLQSVGKEAVTGKYAFMLPSGSELLFDSGGATADTILLPAGEHLLRLKVVEGSEEVWLEYLVLELSGSE